MTGLPSSDSEGVNSVDSSPSTRITLGREGVGGRREGWGCSSLEWAERPLSMSVCVYVEYFTPLLVLIVTEHNYNSNFIL